MPLDSLHRGDGQTDVDTQLTGAVSTPSPALKRGRFQKASQDVAPQTGVRIETQIGSNAVADGVGHDFIGTQVEGVHPSAPHFQTPVHEPVGGGQGTTDLQRPDVSPSSHTVVSVTDADGGGEVRAKPLVTPCPSLPDLAPLIEDLITLQKDRIFWLRCRNRHNNATVAYVRRRLNWDPGAPESERKKINARALAIVSKVEKGLRLPDEDREIGVKCADIILTAAKAREPIDIALKGVSKKEDPNGVGKLGIEQLMEMRAKQLPVWEWVKEVRGLGALGLAVIVGEAGNLSNYANPGKVWKRLGLAPYKGKSAKTWRSEGGLTADEWMTFGYSPGRRSEMWNRAVPLIKTQVRQVKDDDGKDTGERQALGIYGQVYLDRKKYEIDRDPNISKLWAHARAQHYMEKRLIKHLWQAWKRQPVID